MKEAVVVVTTHVIERAKERLHLNPERTIRFVEKAYARGKRSSDYSRKRERDWMKDKESQGAEVVIYNKTCLVFQDWRCITLYDVPEWFDKPRYYDSSKQRIINVTKYLRYYPVF